MASKNYMTATRWCRALLASCVAGALLGCSSLPNADHLLLDKHSIAFAGRPGGDPTVVFQSGLGDGMSVWAPVLSRLPSTITSFTYDRPGYGGSAAGSGHRDPCTIARELHDVLIAARRRPPYVLVGHSLGGLYQYAFARLYPDETSAILLVDATHPDHWATVQQRSPNTAAVLRSLRTVAFSDTEKREFDDQAACLAEFRSHAEPRIPARLLVRGKAEVGESAEFRALSRELADHWPDLLPGMSISTVDGAGHYIQKERPERIVEEILSLIDRSRTSAAF